ncbi:N-acetyltransferase [Arenibacter sp. TNZ]|jgi:ribosomal protein S18 acetylase RimI-like enzyme|uniref:GNAT family N-acetyltransferase n=1 Tax=Arenibacter TaxID=178469 RepID=UPI000CD3F8D6|nr:MULTISPECIES: GNAT family N-acetyltransferase [Arenibacter]MCM4171903.1 N-acetyltransferase [Arenibacter sp. TNZ]
MIRPYEPSDKESLLKIFSLNTPKYFDNIEIIDFEEYLEENGETYFTIEVNNNIVGGTGYYIKENDKSGRITWVFFDPDYTGQGLGRLAVEHCLKILGEDKRIEKFIVTTSQLAYKFFEKFEFSLNRIEKNYWGEGLDLYEMEKSNK